MAEIQHANAHGQGQVKQKFNTLTLSLFSIVLPSVWSFAATGLVIGIYAGGMPVLIWGALLVGIVLSLLVTSFAEFGSAYPSVAGCLVLATKLGGPEYGRICGFMTGGIHALASLVTPACLITAHSPFFTAMAMVMHPDWQPTKWQSFLIYQAVNIVTIFICFKGSRFLGLMATAGAFVLFALFFTCIGVIVGCADPIAPSEAVWSKVQNFTGWPNGFAFLIGVSSPLSGYGPTHWILNMAEEVKNPRRAIPIALLAQQVGSIVTLFVFFIAIGYGVGNDWDAIVGSRYPVPMAAIFEYTTRSKAGTVILLFAMVALGIVSAASYISAALRLIYGSARTGAFPFSGWLSEYDTKLQIPKNILWCIFGLNVVLGCLELGSSSAVVTLVGAAVVLFTIGYLPIFVGYILTGGRYLGNNGWFKLPRSLSLALAWFNSVSIIMQSILLCLPPSNPITAENMNWASAVAGALVIFLLSSYWVYGKSTYQPSDDLIICGEEITGEDGLESTLATEVSDKELKEKAAA
ncbi:hypothetical protein NW759_006035 [Fusarium solani]|nr:hypothetical protein NW759_006035 [Fusarium solani]